MKKFMILERKDVALTYVSSLLSAGYGRTNNPDQADFLFYDLEENRYKKTIYKFIGKKPIFIYPHSALSWYYWDGFYPESPVSCNFVSSKTIKAAMKSYGYESRVESCGFPRCALKDWRPADNGILLYAPYHTLGIKGMDTLIRPGDLKINQDTYKKVLKIAPFYDHVFIKYGLSLNGSGLKITNVPNVRFGLSSLYTSEALRAIDIADVVISAGTFAYLAVARGKPTIFFGPAGIPPREIAPDGCFSTVRSYDKYPWIDYPFHLEDMSIRDIYKFPHRKFKEVSEWRKKNIGYAFNEEKFLSIIKEYV